MYGKKEFKLGTRSQVSIVSSYICEVRNSNCPRCHLVDHVMWKCYVSSYGKITSRHMEIIFSMGNFGILHTKYNVLPQVSTHVEMKL